MLSNEYNLSSFSVSYAELGCEPFEQVTHDGFEVQVMKYRFI